MTKKITLSDYYYKKGEIDALLNGKANVSHTHTTSQITDFPTDVTANGDSGLMSGSDKAKLDGIEDEANNYTHPSYTAKTGKPTANQTPGFGETATVSQIKSDTKGHVIEANDFTIKIPNTTVTTSIAGLMSSNDKVKLNGIDIGANNYTHPSHTANMGKPTSDQTPNFGENVTISQIVNDTSGHVTEVNDRTIKIPDTLANGTTAGLSTNNYTTTEKNKLSDIANGANKTIITNNLTTTTTGTALDAAQGKALKDAIDAKTLSNLGGTVTVEKQQTAESGYTATYIVKQNNTQVGAKINIPKDFLVRSASLKTCTTANTPLNGLAVNDPYIDFVVNTTNNDDTDSHFYINVKDLVDTYTAGTGLSLTSGAFSVKYGTAAGTACQGNDSRLSNARTPTSHAVNANTYGLGTTGVYGHTKIVENLTTNTGDGLALGAGQGKELKAQIDGIVNGTIATDHNHDGRYIKDAAGTVTSSNIVDGTIVNGDIANTTIQGGKLVNGTITATQLASNAVETAKIKDANVTNAKLADQTNTVTEYIVGTQTASTGAWTGKSTKITSLQAGQVIYYKLPYAGSGNATLNLTLADGTTTTGAKEVWFWSGSRVTTHYGANSVIGLVYNGSQWWVINPSSNNSNYYLNSADYYTTGEALTAQNLIACKKADKKYYKVNTLASTVVDISRPILLANGTANANTNTNSAVIYHPWVGSTALNGGTSMTFSSTVYQPVYLEGTGYSNNEFTLSSTPITQTLTSGRFYILIGIAYNTTGMGVDLTNQQVFYYNGTTLIPATSWNGLTNRPSTFTPSSHTHGNITNAGAIGTTANLPVITTTSGKLTTGSFGTAANTFCQGNDSRLSNTRTPTDGSVTTAKIADSNVTTAKIADSAVTSAKIADGTIANADIANTTITGGKLVNGTITATQLASNAVETAKIKDANITTAKIADSAVTSGKIADGTIVNGDIANTTIQGGKLVNGTITATQLASNAVETAKIKDANVTVDKFKVQYYGGRNLLPDTQQFGSLGTNTSNASTQTSDYYNNTRIRQVNASSLTSGYYDIGWTTAPAIGTYTHGDYYTFSFWAKGNGKIICYFYGPTNHIKAKPIRCTSGGNKSTAYNDGSCEFTLTNDWKRYYVTWHLNPTSDSTNLATVAKYVWLRTMNGVNAYYAGPMLEKGEIPHEWSPNPEEKANASHSHSYISTAAGSVGESNLASNAVTTAKIKDANVTTAKIADSAITSAKIADGTIANGDIANTTIQGGKLVNGTITATQLASNAVETAKIKDGAVTNAKFSPQIIANGTNLNTIRTPGFYYQSANNQTTTMTNLPDDQIRMAFTLFVESLGSNTFTKQTLTYWDYDQKLVQTYIRTSHYSNDTWTTWQKVQFSDNHHLLSHNVGDAGYFKFLTLQTTGRYHDQTISFNITHRSKPKTNIQLTFSTYQKSGDTTNYWSKISMFYYDGYPTPVYYVQTTDEADKGVYDFYIKRDTWDTMSVSDLHTSKDNKAGLTVNRYNTFVTSLPSGTIQATINPYYKDTNTTYSAEKGITLSSGKFGHSNTAITAGTNYNGNQTPGFGATFNIPKLTYDAYGHITASANSTVTLPSLGTTSTTAAKGDHTHSYLPLAGGTLTGGVKYPCARTTTADADNLVFAGTVPYDTDLMTTVKANKSFIGAVKTGSTNNDWKAVISNRYRNCTSDGTAWGFYLYAPLVSAGNLVWRQDLNGATSSDKIILDSSNYSTYANKYTHPSYTALTGVPTQNATLSHGGTFTVSQPVTDATGHVTALNTRTYTLPADNNTTYTAGDGIKLDGTTFKHNSGTGTAQTTQSVYSIKFDKFGHINAATAVSSMTPTSHTHGNITNDGKLGTASRFVVTDSNKKITVQEKLGNITLDGKVGTAASKPLITTTNGVVTTGSFGSSTSTSATEFVACNDSRLSNARTPTDGSVTNAKVANNAAIAYSKLSGVAASNHSHGWTKIVDTASASRDFTFYYNDDIKMAMFNWHQSYGFNVKSWVKVATMTTAAITNRLPDTDVSLNCSILGEGANDYHMQGYLNTDGALWLKQNKGLSCEFVVSSSYAYN